MLVPAYAIVQGKATIFYLLYLFWWHELIIIVIAYFYSRFGKKNYPETADTPNLFFPKFFMLFIYIVFIVVVFCFIANWENDQLLIFNFKVLLLRDWLFNCNLLGFVLYEWYWRYHYQNEIKSSLNPFSGRMIVLHISIIFGGVLYFFVVKRFPQIFTSQNLWGSAVIAVPFLLLKGYMGWKNQKVALTPPKS